MDGSVSSYNSINTHASISLCVISDKPNPRRRRRRKKKIQGHLLYAMDKNLEKEPQVCGLCKSWLELHCDKRLFVACNVCGCPVCRTCYEFILIAESRSCPKCNSIYKGDSGRSSLIADELQCTADSRDNHLRYTLDPKSPDNLPSKKDLYNTVNFRRDEGNAIEQYPKSVSLTQNVPETSSQNTQTVCAEKPSPCITNCTQSYSYLGVWGRKKGCATASFVPCLSNLLIPDRQTYTQASVIMSFESPLWNERLQHWKLAQEKTSCASESEKFLEVDDSLLTEAEWEQLEKDEEIRQPLSRKISIPSSKINPYRAVVLVRLVALAFYFRYRLVNPVLNAYGLWLTSIVCEAWFALTWILDQLPKLQPVNRETYPERLCLRYNYPGKQCQLACIDVIVTITDPLKEPPLVISNTVLSVLAVDYPADRITCYVSDDGASMLTLETLSETCQFARKWVPFCRKFNIEPRSPEYYFSQKVDYLINHVDPMFAKERRALKRQYEEFKVQINSLVAQFQKTPADGWIMKDGTPWPGNNTHNHPAMIQILLGRNGPRDSEGKELPQLVYVSREKSPGYQHNNAAGAMNSLVRVSAILTNGGYVLNLNFNQYINNSKALLEAMCFMMDPSMAKKTCYVQFPQRFDDIDSSDHYANSKNVFYDIHMKGLDGIQGPFYIGTGCIFNRKALYGHFPSAEPKGSSLSLNRPWDMNLDDRCDFISNLLEEDNLISYDIRLSSLEMENPSLLLSLKKYFGESSALIASIIVKDSRFSRSASPEELLKEAIRVISCGYEDGTAWGREVGWIYGSLASDILTGLKMHARGWKSIYCMPSCPAFKGTAPANLSDRLNQVFQWSLGSIEIFFSRHCPIWYGRKLRLLERMAYINATIYPFTSIPLVTYCTLPAICLITGKFILPQISLMGNLCLMLLFLSTFASGILEMRWSGVTAQEWWRHQQFRVIGGVSAYLFAVICGTIKILVGKRADLTMLTDKSAEDDFPGLYAFRWTSLLILPTTVIMINLWALIAGLSSATNAGFGSWSPLFAKLFFSFLVIIHLYPFLKGLLVRQNRIPTVVVIWSLLLASLFSILWVRVNPFVARIQGPNVQSCGIYC